MARKKYKLTGFARFFIVMLFLIPIAFLTATYINQGEEGINSLFGGDGNKEKTEISVTTPTSKNALQQENQALRDSIRKLNLEYQELKREYRLLENSNSN